MSENELYYAKQNSRDEVLEGLISIKKACDDLGMDEDEIMSDLDDVIYDAGLESFKLINL